MADHISARSPQEKVCGYEYTVRRGDSFYLIANRLGVPLRDLLEANSHINPARLMVGDVLCIPMEEDDAPQAQPPAQTPVQPPTVQSPATQPPAQTEPQPPEQTSPEQPSIPSQPIPPEGEEDLDAPATLPPTDTVQDGTAADSAVQVCPEANRHVVAQGETAADIQLRTNLTLHTLQAANPTLDLSALRPGQTICVPDENVPCPTSLTYSLQSDDTLESVALKLNASLSALLRANPCLAPSDFRAGACIYIPED